MIFTCPHCHLSATLQHARHVWIVGDVVEFAVQSGRTVTCTMTEDDDEVDQEDEYFLCGDCGERLTTAFVASLYADKDDDDD